MGALFPAALFEQNTGNNLNVWEQGGPVTAYLTSTAERRAAKRKLQLHVSLRAKLKNLYKKIKLLILYTVNHYLG